MSVRIRAGSRFKRFLCLILINVMSSRTPGCKPTCTEARIFRLGLYLHDGQAEGLVESVIRDKDCKGCNKVLVLQCTPSLHSSTPSPPSDSTSPHSKPVTRGLYLTLTFKRGGGEGARGGEFACLATRVANG
jgi:hypothetical protein